MPVVENAVGPGRGAKPDFILVFDPRSFSCRTRAGFPIGGPYGPVQKLQNLPEGFGSRADRIPERERVRVRRYAPVRGVGSISPGPRILRYLADPRGMVRLVDTRRLSATVCDALRHLPRWRAMAHLSRNVAGRGSLGCSA